VGYVTKESSAIKQFFTRRAIIIGGPLLAEDISDEALSMLLTSLKNLPSLQAGDGGRLPIYIETRNFHDYSKWKEIFEACGFSYQPHLNIQVACIETHTMSEQRRRQVKKGISNGAIICEAESEQEILDWYKILHRLYHEKVHTPLFTEEFFLEFYRKGFDKFLIVKYEDKVIGGMMCPILEGKAIYEWYVCGLDEEYRELYPSVMATYAAIEYAKEHHIPLFDFMGAGKPNEPYGVRDFKMEFGGEQVEYGRFLCIRKPILYAIGKLGVKWLKRKRK
jgi:lipid II:glycine glycyltransferase (peptidoglycan interpeptide bridge formation enzyme)